MSITNNKITIDNSNNILNLLFPHLQHYKHPKKENDIPPYTNIDNIDNIKNNKITIDNSNNILNLVFPPLQHYKHPEKNTVIPPHTKIQETNIDNINHNFNMKFRNLLDKVRETRKENKTDPHMIMRNILDQPDKDISNNEALVPKNYISKYDFDQLLDNINKKYNCIKTDADTFFKYSSTHNTIFGSGSSFKDIIKVKNKGQSTYPVLANRDIISPLYRPAPLPPLAPLPPPPPPPPPRPKKKITIHREIHGLDDLMQLIEDYPLKDDVEYNIDMAGIHAIQKPLDDLREMVGMKQLKDAIVDQVIYFIQNLHKNKSKKGNDFMHTVIYGPPGTGKTEIAKIMGRIFSGVGVLEKGKFKKVTRVDLIAGYLGQTAIKTTEAVKECLGGVLFIDEAYSLGNKEKRDSFSKECIDTLCEALSDHKDNLMVIIAGYKDDLAKCFFSYNQGLESRFPWRFQTDDYSATELNLIFQKKINDIGWRLQAPLKDRWFEPKMKYFTYYGRDMETLFSKIKIAHGRRVFCKSKDYKMIITSKDMDKGFAMFLRNNKEGGRRADDGQWNNLYI